MVAFTAASRQRSNLEAACRAAGFAPQIVAETSDLGVTIELIQQQIGAAVLPKSLLAGAAKVTQLSLTRPKLDRRILLVWPPQTAHRPPAPSLPWPGTTWPHLRRSRAAILRAVTGRNSLNPNADHGDRDQPCCERRLAMCRWLCPRSRRHRLSRGG
jgi:hypothetical protein